MNRIHFQPGLPKSEFLARCGSEAPCEQALALKCQLGVSYPTAWLKQAMARREERYVLEGHVQIDDA